MTTAIVAAVTAAVLALAGCSDDASTDARPPDGGSPSAAPTSPRAKASPKPKPEPDPPQSVAALGDSITRGFDACRPLSDCPSASWATGTSPEVDSLAQRLLDNPSGHTWNFARTGAQMADLPAQTDEAIGRSPDLVTVLIGANDACTPNASRMTPVPDFRTSLAASLRRLAQELPQTRVYVSSVPSLLQLWEVGHDNPMTRQIWSLGICQSMLEDADDLDSRATARRARVQERVVEYNTVLEEECAKHDLCTYDGGAAFSYDFSGSHLSRWDFFHPDKDGQRTLAKIAYRRLAADGAA